MVLEFYFDLLSQPCRALYVFMKATGVEFEPKVIDLMKRDHYKPEFIAKNPYHKVPVIDDDGFLLSETVAIMRYIATKHNLEDHWYPRQDVRQQARVEEFLHWQHACVRKHCLDLFLLLFRSRVGVGRFTKEPLDEEKLKGAKEEVARTVDHIAEYFLGDKPYISGDQISAADIIGVMELVQLEGVGEDGMYTSNEKVKQWVERTKDKLQPYTDESLVKLAYIKKMFAEATP